MKTRPILTGITILLLLVVSCSGHSASPVAPAQTANQQIQPELGGAHLWGVWDIWLDPISEKIEAVPLRGVAFTANVVTMVDKAPASLLFKNFQVSLNTGAVDLDVGIRHPLQGQPTFTGFDVIGVFMCDGLGAYLDASGAPKLNPGAVTLVNADGYTRWFNAPEFAGAGQQKPLFGYTPGEHGSPICNPQAILNPYKYFTDGLGANDSASDYLLQASQNRGSFAPGSTNYRHYSLVFPNLANEGARFQYAIAARWAPPVNYPNPPASLDEFPSSANASEALVVSIFENSSAYYTPNGSGGNVSLRIGPSDWSVDCDGIVNEYKVRCFSDAWQGPYEVDMTCQNFPEDAYSTYFADIPVQMLSSTDALDVWVEVTYETMDYKTGSGVGNLADGVLTSYVLKKVAIDGIMPGSCDNGWAQTWGHKLGDHGGAVATRNGNVFVAGMAELSVNGNDCLLAKYSACGKLLWGCTWGSAGEDAAYGIALDNFGNIYVTGKVEGSVDINPGTGVNEQTAVGSWDCFISKFSNSGVFQWAVRWGSDSLDSCTGIDVDSSGNVYAVGFVWDTTDFDPGPGEDIHPMETGPADAFITKFDSSGNFQWARTWGSTGSDKSYGVAVSGTGDAYAAGVFDGTVDFDPSSSGSDNHVTFGFTDAFVSKFDSSGNYQWAKTWGSDSFDESHGCTVDTSGNVFITGFYRDLIDLDPGFGIDNHPAFEFEDVFLSKLDSAGNYLWGRTWGGTSGNDLGYSVDCDSTGNVYTAGSFSGSVDFDPGSGISMLTSAGSEDAFLSKFDSAGSIIWARRLGGIEYDEALGVSVGADSNPRITGFFGGSTDFAPSYAPCGALPDIHTSSGSSDLYVGMWKSDGCW